jgi:hypothetical protein
MGDLSFTAADFCEIKSDAEALNALKNKHN